MSCCKQNPGSAIGVPLDPPASLPMPAHWPQGVSLDMLGLARMPHKKDGTVVSGQSKRILQVSANAQCVKSYDPENILMFTFRLTGLLTLENLGISVKKEHKSD